MMAWLIYQAIYSRFAPDYSVIWECIYYILLYVGIGCLTFNIKSNHIIVRFILLYVGIYAFTLSIRYIYLVVTAIDYETYHYSVSDGWVKFKLFFPVFVTALIIGFQDWRENR